VTESLYSGTAFAEETRSNQFLKMGFTDFITKPIRPKKFLESIASPLSRNQRIVKTLEQTLSYETILDKSIILNN